MISQSVSSWTASGAACTRKSYGVNPIALGCADDRKLRALLALALALGLTPDDAWSQDADAIKQEAKLEEVVVTAQKQAQSLMDVPLSLSALGKSDLERLGISGAQGLQVAVPGLVFTNTGPNAQPYLRGVGTRLTQSGLDPSVATYVDDLYISRPTASMFEFADTERVEVLKGPQGVLYGRNATGGAIRVITKDVGDDMEGSLKLSAGNYDAWGASGTVNVPLGETFGMRLTGMVKQRDGFAKNLDPRGVSELDDKDYQAYRAKFRWDMTTTATARLLVDYWTRNDTESNEYVDVSPPGLNVGIARGGISGTKRDEAATALNRTLDGDQLSAQLSFDVAFDGFDFYSASTYSDLDQALAQEGDGTSTVLIDAVVYDQLKNYSQEFRVASHDNSIINWLIGTYFFSEDSAFDINIFNPSSISTGFQALDTQAAALFGQATWNMSDRWALTLGGRFSRDEKKVKVERSRIATTTVTAGLPIGREEQWEEFTPKATLEYKMNPGLVYLTYARGFKSGGYNYPATTATLDPEILDMYELGFKREFMQETLRLSAAAYYYDYKDLQVTRAAAGATATVTTENAANAEIVGFDLDVTWLLTDRLTLTAAFNLLSTQFKDYAANAKVFNAVATGNPTAPGMRDVSFDADGEDMLRAPKFSALLSMSYEFAFGGADMPLSISYSYKDKYNFDFVVHPTSEPLVQDSYGLLSARLGYKSASGRWVASIWGENLTDEEYFNDVVGNAAGLRASWGAPRTYGIDLTFNF